jgi:4-alpha-glucanotransferase
MKNERSSGVLCHISSLPSSYGIGDLGPEAFEFVDALERSRQRYWQVLPLNPTDRGLGNSPYSSYSAFAFNPLLISPEGLYKDGLLTRDELQKCRIDSDGIVAFDQVYDRKAWMIGCAYNRYQSQWFKSGDFDKFCLAEKAWLDDHALFVVLKHRFKDVGWFDWPVDFRDRHPDALQKIAVEVAHDVRREKFAQFLFHGQWMKLRAYCLRKGVRLIGDVPIYVNYDSVDVWRTPQFFKLDEHGRQTFVAGVPPDYFSKEGQRWGNPVYNWDNLKKAGFAWWIERVGHNLDFFDLVRIDHFRAFAQCWEIPASEPTAVKGVWRDVPGVELFTALQKAFPKLPIIAEDLGIITPDVDALKDRFCLPGMHVLMFAFHNEYKKSRDLPENSTPLSVVYTGTHDNNTIAGWFSKDITPMEKKNMREYFCRDIAEGEVNWVMIELALRSAAFLAVIPMQDLLGLKEGARMNTPSTVKGNWAWRFMPGAFTPVVADRLASLVMNTKR